MNTSAWNKSTSPPLCH